MEAALLVPMFPLLGFLILFATAGHLPRTPVAFIGTGSIALAALTVLGIGVTFVSGDGTPVVVSLYTWINVGGFAPGFSFYIDGLSLTMMAVVTGVGFLIHVYSALFMHGDEDYSRFFAYMNLFVSAMLILVLADNLLLLYLGWEGVGLCSYLLVGFWYKDPVNGAAARKAFIVTRIGDTFMALGLFLLFLHLGTLTIQPLMQLATTTWQTGDSIPTVAALLLLAGAVGKSAQLPLQTWLPDAMAGPTPVSALIHAATMVTAGVYLIARTHTLFLLAPTAQLAVALVGLATLLMAACSALVQTDIKRILAFSTISQIGYMFLALGVGAWSSAIFHLMTHAFFKALLFLAAGAVIFSLHHEHNIHRMGGLRTRLPVAFWSFMIGSAALTALPPTAGYWSKDAILLAAFAAGDLGPWLWTGGVIGALLTAVYSFRLVFVVFFGPINTAPEAPAGLAMSIPLVILCGLSIAGGLVNIPVDTVFPAAPALSHDGLIPWLTALVPIVGVILAYFVYLDRRLQFSAVSASRAGRLLRAFWFSHWAMDWLYDRLFVRPFMAVARINKDDVVDRFYTGLALLAQHLHRLSSLTQTGQLRSYVVTIAGGLIVMIAIVIGAS